MAIKTNLKPKEAWDSIDPSQFTDDNILHLLRRASWAARPVDLRQLSGKTPDEAMKYLFHRSKYPQPHPVLEDYVANINDALGSEIEEAMEWAKTQPRWKDRVEKVNEPDYKDPHARAITVAHYGWQRSEARKSGDVKTFRAQFRDRFKQREYWNKYALEWLKIASTSSNSAFEKMNGFLQNICVVNLGTLRTNSDYMADLHNQHRVMRDNFFEPYPEILKRMAKTHGMAKMLDLTNSTKARPNENFARELMELFSLGVDNGYEEDDIKEACRAWTGYVIDPDTNPYTLPKGKDEMILSEKLHDPDKKRVFGRSRKYDGDEIVDLIFTKPEAETFVPHELARYFLLEGGLPKEYLEPLGRKWREADFNFGWLIETFFKSKIFYDPAFRAQIYKSPFQFYLGLLQDLGLQVEPSLAIIQELDYLGQSFGNPPDVNGWNGGAFWMNNGSINGRRIIVERLFSGSYRRGGKMTSAGAAQFVVTDEVLKGFIESKDRSDAEVVDHFVTYFIPIRPSDSYVVPLREHYGKSEGIEEKVQSLREVILTILQSQYYQVC